MTVYHICASNVTFWGWHNVIFMSSLISITKEGVFMKRIVCVFLIFLLMFSGATACSKTEKNRKENKIKIGIIDTSISNSTIERYNITYQKDFVGEAIEEDDTHGAMVLGIIEDSAKNCEFYYSQAIDSTYTGEISNVTNSIIWCIENNVDIICMSFATTNDNHELKEMVKKAQENGIVLVASCINCSPLKCYPAMYNGVVSVSEGMNKNASVIIKYGENTQYESCSELTAFVSGEMASEFSKGNKDISKILKNIQEN